MNFKYQLIILGSKNIFKDEILKTFWIHIKELGLSMDNIQLIEEKNFVEYYSANCPTFCIYFGNEIGDFKDIGLIEKLIKDATLILPIVNNIKKFAEQCPKLLADINGFQLANNDDVEKIVSIILEGFGLLRISRRIFISYKRDESSSVAIQLFEELERSGFDVFLDTHSIRPSEPFQDELWHRLADTDVVVLLNTPDFLKSNWTTQELAKANSMTIGILQLIWPLHKLERDAELSIPVQLTDNDFGNPKFKDEKSYLIDSAISSIVSQVESLRARCLASRQDNLISEFMSYAAKLGKNADLQPERFITVKTANGSKIEIIPTVGVPQAFTYNQSEELIFRIDSKKASKIYLLYDQRNIRDKWINHLGWLDNHLPVKTIKITDSELWLNKI